MSITTEGRDEVGPGPEMVERRARIFRFGHFPEKGRGGWGITRDEFVAANGESGTVPIGIDPVRRGHYLGEDSAFDGLTGEAAFTVEGQEVFATLRMPAIVDRARARKDLKVSGVFHPTARTMSKIDLVERPYFPDAVVFAEAHDRVLVSEDDEPEEVAFECASCKAGKDKGEDDGEGRHHEAYQTMHDLAAHGRPSLCDGKVGFAGPEKKSGHDLLFRQMHHHAVHMGAYCPAMPDGIDHEEIGMSDDLEDEEAGATGADEVGFEDETPRERAMRLRMERLEVQLAEKDAVAFAREVTTGRDARATPAERKAIEEGYARAARVDAAIPESITFTEGTASRQGTHVDAFRALILARPRLGVAGSRVAGTPAEVAFTALDMEPEEAAGRDRKELDDFEAKARAYATRLNGHK